MVGRDLGEERAQHRTHQLHQRVDDPRVLGDLEQAEEQRQHADQAQRDLRGGLREVERRGGDRVQLDEADGLEDHAGSRTAGLETDQRALQLLVPRLGHLADGRERLGQLGLGLEAELRALPGLEQVAG